MSTSRPFAYNPGSPINGTIQVGNLAVGYPTTGYTGMEWWNGPDEDLGYVIGQPVPDDSQPSPVFGKTGSVGFFRTSGFNDNEFLNITNILLNGNYTNPTLAATDLTTNGYWNSYPLLTPVLSLDAGNSLSYPGSGSTWTDTISGKTFTLFNTPTYSSSNGGYLNFIAASSQYAQTNTSLPSLSTFTTSVWHYWDGTNVGSAPCILTEIYVGGPINYFLGNLLGTVAQSGYFNGGFRVSPQFGLTANTWYNIVTTCDSSQVVRVYINNVLISTTSTSGSQPSSSNAGIRLMRRWDLPDYWGGRLAKFDIYNQPLDQGQITSLWNTNKSRFGL
jgi:hypothetical protein